MTECPPGEIPGLSPEQIAALRSGGTVTINPSILRSTLHGYERATDKTPREMR